MKFCLLTFAIFTITIFPEFIYASPERKPVTRSDLKCDKPVREPLHIVRKEAKNLYNFAEPRSITKRHHRIPQGLNENHIKLRSPRLIAKENHNLRESINLMRLRRNQHGKIKANIKLDDSPESSPTNAKPEADKNLQSVSSPTHKKPEVDKNLQSVSGPTHKKPEDKSMLSEILNLVLNINDKVGNLNEHEHPAPVEDAAPPEKTKEFPLVQDETIKTSTSEASEYVPSTEANESKAPKTSEDSQEEEETDESAAKKLSSSVQVQRTSNLDPKPKHHDNKKKDPKKTEDSKKEHSGGVNLLDLLEISISKNSSKGKGEGYSNPYIARTLIVFAVLIILLVIIFLILVGRLFFPNGKDRFHKKGAGVDEYTDAANDEFGKFNFHSMIESASHNDDDLPPKKDHIHQIKRRIGEDEDFLSLDKFEGWRHRGYMSNCAQNVPSITRMMVKVDPCVRVANPAESQDSNEVFTYKLHDSSGKESLENMVEEAVDDACSVFDADGSTFMETLEEENLTMPKTNHLK